MPAKIVLVGGPHNGVVRTITALGAWVVYEDATYKMVKPQAFDNKGNTIYEVKQ